jgi:CubicO group peptidase (beta-lactamase class C family)
MSDVLAEVDDWPVETVGVGVTDAGSTLATHGAVDAVLPLASVTKPLTAYAVLIAVQDRVVHLEEPVTPEDADTPKGITVRHLLAHASGLPLERDGLVGAPGRKRIYSNWGFEVLADLVSERTGMSFAGYLDTEVLHPLGMDATRLEGSAARDGRGTVRDLLAFGRELLAPQLLDEDLHREATSAVFPELDGVVPGFGRQSPNPWGLGYEIKAAKDPHWTGSSLSPETFGHFGQSGSFLWVDPTRDLACALLADRDFGAWSKELWPVFNDRVVAAFRE